MRTRPALATASLAVAALVTTLAAPAGAQAPPSRIAGADRFETAVALSRAQFPVDDSPAPVVYVTGADAVADALTAGPSARRGVILPVTAQGVPPVVASELQRLAPSRIVVVGGTDVVPVAVQQELDAYGPTTRIGGGDRYETAARLSVARFPAQASSGDRLDAWIVSGRSFADALAAGPRVPENATLLPVEPGALPPSVAAELERLQPRAVTIVGGGDVVSPAVAAQLDGYADEGVRRIAGGDRYETAALLSRAAFADGASVVTYHPSGDAFVDALAAGPVVGRQPDAPLLPVRADAVPPVIEAELQRLAVRAATVIGGTDVVSDDVLEQLGAITGAGDGSEEEPR